MRVGKYFTLDEFTASQAAARRGLSNTPEQPALDAIKDLCKHVLDPLRASVQNPVVISSGYRSAAVNAAVGGSRSSQHRLGQAADIIVPGLPPNRVVSLIRSLNLPFDQLINEFNSWVHVSYGPRHRRQVLLAERNRSGATFYTPQD